MCVPCEWVSVFCECLVSAQIPETHETHVEPDEIAVSKYPPVSHLSHVEALVAALYQHVDGSQEVLHLN